MCHICCYIAILLEILIFFCLVFFYIDDVLRIVVKKLQRSASLLLKGSFSVRGVVTCSCHGNDSESLLSW